MLNFGDDIKNYIKFNSKQKIWSINDEDGEVVQISPPRFIIDLERLITAWLYFREGQAPSIILDVDGVKAPEPDGGNHKRGFVVDTFSPELGVRDFTSCSYNLKKAIKLVYAEFEKGRETHTGEVPVISVTGHIDAPSQYGLNYQPIFAVTGWVARPVELGGAATIQTLDTVEPKQIDVAQVNAPLTDDLNDTVPF
tara:strand:+ start:2252 stop:2839 length:588 start_codon:yes stop_codon:yes gene_type:complete